MKCVDKRDADTLIPLIQKMILPGTIIVSDSSSAFSKISELPENYTHCVVDHSFLLKNIVSEEHSSTMYGFRSLVTAPAKAERGNSKALDSSLVEIMFRRKFPVNSLFYVLLVYIGDLYKCLE